MDLHNIPSDVLLAEIQRRLNTSIPAPGSPQTRSIIDAVCSAFDIDALDIYTRSNKPRVTIPRHAAMLILREQGSAWSDIGELFGLTHGAAIYGAGAAQRLISSNSHYAETVQQARNVILDYS